MFIHIDVTIILLQKNKIKTNYMYMYHSGHSNFIDFDSIEFIHLL